MTALRSSPQRHRRRRSSPIADVLLDVRAFFWLSRRLGRVYRAEARDRLRRRTP